MASRFNCNYGFKEGFNSRPELMDMRLKMKKKSNSGTKMGASFKVVGGKPMKPQLGVKKEG